MDQPGTLIKFGKLEHLQQLRDDGLLYLNNLPYFWNIEDEELRGDPYDCALQVVRGPKVTVVMPYVNEVTVCTGYTAFMQRLESTLKTKTLFWKTDLVEYVNDEHTGELGPFRKFNRFSYQYEWRLVCHDGPSEPLKVPIGSIRDISMILPANEVNQRIQIHYEPDGT